MGRRATETTTEQGEKTSAVIEYIAPGGAKSKKIFEYVPTSQNVSTYSVIWFTDPDTREQQSSDVMTSSQSDTTSILAQVNPQICTGFLEAGIGVNGGLISSQITIRNITYVIGRDGPRASRDEERQFLSEIAFAGGIGIPAQAYVVNDEPVNLTNGLIHTGTLINDYYVDETAGTTKTVTSRYIAQGLTTEGKSSFAKRAAEADTVEEVLAAIRDASFLVFDGISVRSSVGRDYGVDSRSSDQQNTSDNLGSYSGSQNLRFSGLTNGDAGFSDYDAGDPLGFPPDDPIPGDFWTNLDSDPFIWDGDDWIPFTVDPPAFIPFDYTDPTTGIDYTWDGGNWEPVDSTYTDPTTGIDYTWDGGNWEPVDSTYTDPTTGIDYTWDGSEWEPPLPGFPTLPDSPTLPGDIYIDPSTGIEYEWDGSDWIPTDNEFGSTPDSGIDSDFDDGVIGDVITLPFPNDDVLITIPDDEGNLDDWLAPGGADLQAIALAELEQALRYGHAYGANITLEAWVLPTAPLEPYTVRAGGLEVQYLADGCSWEWDANALVVSCDGLYIGVTGRVAGEDVVPWAPGFANTAGLPVVGTPTVNSGAKPANTIPTPIGFQASRPGGMWNLLPTNGVDEYEETSEPSHVIAPYSVRERSETVTRSLVVETEVPYSLEPVTETIVAVSRSTASVSGLISLAASSGTVAVAGQEADLDYFAGIRLAAEAGSVAVAGVNADLVGPIVPVATFELGVADFAYSNSDRTITATAAGGVESWARIATTQTTGKWYLELETNITSADFDTANAFFGFSVNFTSFIWFSGQDGFASGVGREVSSFDSLAGGTAETVALPSYTGPAVFMLAIDYDAKKAWLGQGGVWMNSGDPAAGTGSIRSGWDDAPLLRPAALLLEEGMEATISEAPIYAPSGFGVFPGWGPSSSVIELIADAGAVTVTGQDATIGTVTPPASDDDGFGLLGLLTLTEGLTVLNGET